jgi:4-amino-4-deoxy-L-arabinose transferase-like glycosyltransferase
MLADAPAPSGSSAHLQAALWAITAFGLALPLWDLASYPDRLSILPSLQVDAATYDALAAQIAAGGGLASVPVRQPPGFVVLLAGLYGLVGHSTTAAKLLLWAAHAASVLLAATLARHVWGPSAAATAAALVATAPALRHYDGTVQYEVLVGAWWLGLVWLVATVSGWRQPTCRRLGLVAAALACGALVLTREVFIVLVPLLAIWAAARRRSASSSASSPAMAAAEAVAFLALAAAPVVAWSAYQSARSGQLVVISDKGAVTFALGNNPRATGTYDTDVIDTPAGLAFVVERPGDAAALVARKSGYFWGIRRDVWNVPRPAALWLHRASLGLLPFDALLTMARGGWLLVAFLVASWLLVRQGRAADWWILPGSVLGLWAAHAVTLASHRFAVPVLPVVAVLAAGPVSGGLSAAWTWLRASRRRLAALAASLTLAVAAQAGPWPGEVTYPARGMDAMNAVNVVDQVTGRPARFAAASSGARPVAVLADQYLPGGSFQVVVAFRRGRPGARCARRPRERDDPGRPAMRGGRAGGPGAPERVR